jgi:hypothetical protein
MNRRFSRWIVAAALVGMIALVAVLTLTGNR